MTDLTREDKSYCESYIKLLFYEVESVLKYIRRGDSENALFYIENAQCSIAELKKLIDGEKSNDRTGKER